MLRTYLKLLWLGEEENGSRSYIMLRIEVIKDPTNWPGTERIGDFSDLPFGRKSYDDGGGGG